MLVTEGKARNYAGCVRENFLLFKFGSLVVELRNVEIHFLCNLFKSTVTSIALVQSATTHPDCHPEVDDDYFL